MMKAITLLEADGQRRGLVQAGLCVVFLLACLPHSQIRPARPTTLVAFPVNPEVNEDETDAALQRAAAESLGGREGTIMALDPRTGRVRVVVNPRLATEGVFPPGSTIKPFTLLAALRSGSVKTDSRLLCRHKYAREDFSIRCAHELHLPPLDAAGALAQSCNYYFAKLGERLVPAAFGETLAEYGLDSAPVGTLQPAMAGAGWRRGPSSWHVRTALGEGGDVLVTPARLLAAYAALFNGGQLWTPRLNPAGGFETPKSARLVGLETAHRQVLLAGMRGAVEEGTATRASLDSLPLHVFGKTGTATQVGDYRTHGWFVGLAADAASPLGDQQSADVIQPQDVRLAVLVFLRRGTGAESAGLARQVFAELARGEGERRHQQQGSHARTAIDESAANGGSNIRDEAATSPAFVAPPRGVMPGQVARVKMVRVRLTRGGWVKTLGLEDYLFGVLAAEASTEGELAALKTQAVVSRTFALNNLRRHASENFNFCDLTHCQRFLHVTRENARPDFHTLLRRALRDTMGEVLLDGRGQLASAYFSASCGGATASGEALWGVPAREAYERGVADEYCAAMPYRSWTDEISKSDLHRALRADGRMRSDVGARLDDIVVEHSDASGRAELIRLVGERTVRLRGWDFKIIVGRTLGWNVLKSSRFTVERRGEVFVFRGSGFGHGLGLCQHGAHVLARRGANYRHIIAHYFPGTNVSRTTTTAARTELPNSSLAHAARLTLASENFRINYPTDPKINLKREAEAALRVLEAARADLRARLAAASLAPPAFNIEVFVHPTTGDFTGATNQPAWVAAVTTSARRIETQPLQTLTRRRILATTLRHEYAHAVIEALSDGRAPRWLVEGLAAHFAGEGAALARSEPPHKLSLEMIEKNLLKPVSAAEMRALYAAAYREVNAIIRQEGEAGIWRRVARS